jgi:hypothetical protein
MPQAIIRVAKIKTAGAARGKTAHNYRLMETPNADPDRTKALNQEYVNTDRADYWTLAEQRITEVVTRKVRDDQVRAMEVVLTASPDWFKRGPDGQAEDMRESQWVTDNLHFLKEKFGEKNVVSFTLHQDEKTPHVHAVVIPITAKNRLSADTLFNPTTLSQLQTDYAAAMAEHGLERGVEGSRRQHQDMKQVYGQQVATAAELAPLVEPAAVQAFVLPAVPLTGRDTWRAQQQEAINAELARQVGEANRRLEKAANVAVAHAGGSERVEVLFRQLAISEGLKQGHFDQLQAQTVRADQLTERSEHLAVQLAQGGGPLVEQLTAYGQQQREHSRQELVKVLENTLAKPISSGPAFVARLYEMGYVQGRDTQNRSYFEDELSGARFLTEELRPNGQGLVAQLRENVERTMTAEFLRSEAGQRATEQAERQARGQQPDQGRAVLEMQSKDLEVIQKHFSGEGAGVRPGPVQADGRVQLEIVYHHTARHVVGVNELLEKAQKWTGVTVQEDHHDREHRQAGAKQMVATMKAEREQSKGKSQDRGVSM